MDAEEIGEKILQRKTNRNRIIEIETLAGPMIQALPQVEVIVSTFQQLKDAPKTIEIQEQKVELANGLKQLAQSADSFVDLIEEQTNLVKENALIEEELNYLGLF